MPKHATTYSTPERAHDGSNMRQYRLPDGSWYDGADNTLHVPVQSFSNVLNAIAASLADHDLQAVILDEVAERLETYELAKYMTGRRS